MPGAAVPLLEPGSSPLFRRGHEHPDKAAGAVAQVVVIGRHAVLLQIVNGCQTSNVLFENYDLLIPESTITVRIIEATDPDVIADVVRATNSQSKVDETQFLSFTNLVRRLERYFATTEDIPGQETKLYFERRNGQYKDAGVVKRRVCSIPETCRAVGAMFLRKPELAYRYPTKMISDLHDKLLND